MKLECHIVADLLPSCIDGTASEQTKSDVSEHLTACERCRAVYDAMTANPTQRMPELDPVIKTKNGKRPYYMKKAIRVAMIVYICVTLLVAGLIGSIVLYAFLDSRDVVDRVSKYEDVLGKTGKYKDNFIGYNNIFPNEIPASAKVEKFYYEYYSPWDANYLGYLVYTCDDEDFSAEYARLRGLEHSDDCFVYGATEFPYELCAVNADSFYGIIYALADKANNRFIYVELEFCNYFTDIDYKSIIDSRYLPKGFDATQNNKTRLEFESRNNPK